MRGSRLQQNLELGKAKFFDPDDLSTAQITATIETASFQALNDADALWASEATGADWFYSNAFPTAVFQSRSVQALGQGAYRVDGELTLKDQIHAISFDFTVNIDGNQAAARAIFPLSRADLLLGLGTHPNQTTVGYEASVQLTILAERF